MVPLVVFGAGKEFQWYRDLVQDSLSWNSLERWNLEEC